MPSDDFATATTATAAIETLRPAIDAYRSAIVEAIDRVESYLRSTREDSVHERAAAQLGEFAGGRIDVERFTAVCEGRPALDEFERAFIRRAREVLQEMESLPDSRFVVNVPSGAQLGSLLAITFAELGRAFGAALIVELVRNGRYEERDHEGLLHGFPRYRWNRMERSVAPPVCLTIDGADLWAGEAAQFLDGNQKLVLVVRPPCPPAPLVRLIVPNGSCCRRRSSRRCSRRCAPAGPRSRRSFRREQPNSFTSPTRSSRCTSD